MYAIVDIAGQQFKVEAGSEIFVNRLASKKDETVEFNKVLLIDNDGTVKVGAPYVEGAVVEGKIEKQGKQKKILVFKYKQKDRANRRTHGHRQPYTKVTITKIEG